MKLLVFAGTTEGTEFTRKALAAGHSLAVSVATEYGADVLKANLSASGAEPSQKEKNLRILHGRLDADEIKTLSCGFDAIVDATHPYAKEVTQNLRAAAKSLCIPYYRLLRPLVRSPYKKIREFSSLEELSRALCTTTGNIFVATGANGLDAFRIIPDYADRLFVRVLPSAESIEKCRALGLPSTHIIAMQGTFSAELNAALFSEYDCSVLVTKESGDAGGYLEKIAAAEKRGMDVYALVPPVETESDVFSSSEDVLVALQR